jgi:fatty acid desaturase
LLRRNTPWLPRNVTAHFLPAIARHRRPSHRHAVCNLDGSNPAGHRPQRKERIMNGKQIGLSIVLLDFLTLTGYAVYHYGYVGFFEMVMANAVTVTAFVDLVIALTLILGWMWRDARGRGLSPVPYVLLTLALGSVGPLAYLIRREASEHTGALAADHAELATR